MFTLCIVTLPVVTLNYFGRAYDFEGSKDWRDLSRASLGNLLPDTYLNGTDPSLDHSRASYYVDGSNIIKVAVPVCRQTEQFAALLEGPDPDLECMLDKASVGKFYMWIDMIVVFVVFVAYLWLKYFEDRAVKRLDSFSVFSSITNVPCCVAKWNSSGRLHAVNLCPANGLRHVYLALLVSKLYDSGRDLF